MIDQIDLNTFARDDGFYGRVDLLITIKSFDLLAIRKRYLASRKRNISGKAGSVERRPVANGGIAAITIEDGHCTRSEVLCRLPEPRAIDRRDDHFAFAAENTVHIFDGDEHRTLENPWFSYIHTIQFSPWHPDRIVIASSGLDCIFEYDFRTGQKTYEWFAWENGFNEAHDPITNAPVFLTRLPGVAASLRLSGKNVTLISDPEEQVLPTAKRAAFINSVCYDHRSRDTLLATFFHEGAVYAIDRTTNRPLRLLDGMKNPHGGRRYGDAFLCTSTSSGEVHAGRTGDKIAWSFCALPGKPSALEDMEWIQNTIAVGPNLISIDSNRSNLTVFDPANKLLSQVPFDENWAIQDLVEGSLNTDQERAIAGL